MAQYSTESVNLGRFDKSASVPDLERGRPDMGKANRYKEIADALGVFGKGTVEVLGSKIERERRDEAEKRRKEIEARQEKNRKENEARIEAERFYTETGGTKSWKELTEEERERETGHPHVHEGGKYTTKEKVLTKDQRESTFLKEAYQQKRTEAVLTKQQADWDVVAPNLVDKVYDQWRDQRNNDDGEPDFTVFAVGKLEIYKLERAEQHFLGLPMLGEARKNVRLNDDNYLSMVAKRKQEYVDEIKDKDIQAGIDTHLTGESPLTDLSNPDKIDALVEHISVATLPGTNKKARLPNGKVVRVHTRDAVQFQLIDDIENKLTNATSSDDPVFKIVEAFSGKNSKKGRMIYERTGGVGDAWKKAVAAAAKKQVSLLDKEKKGNAAHNKIILQKAKEQSNEAIIRADIALDYTTVGGELHQQGEFQRMQMNANGEVIGEPDKLQALQIALQNLDGQISNFTTALMSKEFTDKRAEIVAAINKLDPTHKDFDVPNNEYATKLKSNFIEQISKLDAKGLEDIRTLVHQNKKQLPWMVAMKHKAIKDRYTELDEARERVKDELTIAKSNQQLEENKIKKTSSGLARKLRGEIRDKDGNLLSSKELKDKLIAIGTNKELTDPDAGKLRTEYNTVIASQEKKEHIVTDTKAQTGFFKKITSRGLKGALKTQAEWQTLEDEVTAHAWIEGSPQRTNLLALISAGKNKTGDFDTKREAFIKENEYRTRLATKAKPVEKNLADIIGRVSLSEKHPNKLTVEAALAELKKEQDSFAENFEEIIKEGGTLGIDIDHDERFQDTYAEILGQRTEEDRANVKKTLVQDAKLVEIKREKFKADKLDIIREVTESPLINAKGEKITATDAIQQIKNVFANSLHEERNDLGSIFQSNVFTAKEQDDALRKLQVSIKTETDPSKRVSKDGVITQSYTLQQEAGKLSGTERVEKLEENIVLIETEYLKGNLSTGDFNKERGLIKELQRFGEVKTKPAYQAGENHIRSIFAGHLTKFTNNKMFLPINEDGKLYDALVQGFNQEFAKESKALHGASEEDKLAKAYEIAQKYTTYDPNDKHPLGKTVNERIRRYSMDTLSLMSLVMPERKERIKQNRLTKTKTTETPKTKTTKKTESSENVKKLENSSEAFDALENDPTTYIITPGTGQISILRARDENPQGWLGITWDAVTGIGDDTDETYLTISTPHYLTGS